MPLGIPCGFTVVSATEVKDMGSGHRAIQREICDLPVS